MNKLIIGIPTLNRADLLERCMRSLLCQLDKFDKIIVVDNGKQTIPYSNLNQVELISNPENAGVCKSWNQIIESAFHKHKADWILMLNDDIAFNQRQLSSSIHPIIEHHHDKWLLVSPFYWSVWAMSKDGAKHLSYEPNKWFDEKMFPGYYGDNDMQWRIENLNRSKFVTGVSLFTPEICDSSMSLKSAPELHRKVAESGQYYFQKWGGGPSMEKFKVAFNGNRI